MKFLLCIPVCLVLLVNQLAVPLNAQHIQRVDPPYWFKNMGQDTLQLLLYGDSIHLADIAVSGGPELLSAPKVLNNGYRLLYLRLNPQKQGSFTIQTTLGNQKHSFQYKIKEKPILAPSISPADRMYLLMPDRFANGDVSNDSVTGMLEKPNRKDLHGRHGGDIAGVSQNLNHIKDLGFNALWMTPLLENNQPSQSYHGYACTDHYRIDARFGSFEEYAKLSQKARESGMKWVLDVVYNHVGNEHQLYKKRISDDWFHLRDTFFRSNYRVATLSDPYAAQSEVDAMLEGWFDHHMPDLNQENAHVQRYLIQNTLWWIAVSGASGVRIDTYPYSQPSFLHQLNLDLKKAFPGLFVFGETWEHTLAAQAIFAPNHFNRSPNALPDAVTDFQFCFGLQQALNEPFGWNTGISRMYYLMASDYVYQNPRYLVTFADNHDLNRMHATFGRNLTKTKMALALMYLSRGIPCVFYGTEWLFSDTGAHGAIRRDSPGGWSGDSNNGFTIAGRSPDQAEMCDYLKALAGIRSQYAALFETGKRTQYIPQKGLYAFFIEGEKEILGVFVNQSDMPVRIHPLKYPDIPAVWANGNVILNSETRGSQVPSVSPMGVSVIHYPKQGK
jgi:glycosidase